MYELSTRTIAQGLQAFLPIAFALVWFRAAGEVAPVTGLRWGILAAFPATAVATYGFQATARQALWEATLAMAALLPAIWFARRVWRGVSSSAVSHRHRLAYRLAFVMAAALIIARQAMEIAVTLAAALELRAADPLLAITIGLAISLALSALWLRIGRRLPRAAAARATMVFAVLFVAQLAMYALHESSEAHLLPWSEVLHAATERYGPDGLYGRYVSAALFVLPLGAGVWTLVRGRMTNGLRQTRQAAAMTIGQRAALVAAVLLVAVIEVMTAVYGDRPAAPSPAHTASTPAAGVPTLTASPHLLFRHTAVDRQYSRLSLAPLEAPEPGRRVAAGFNCQRVSYAAGRGICLTADRGVFTTYKAVLFDSALRQTHTMKIAGSPTRTRVSPDGRVGSITVFPVGAAHSYAGSSVSTETTIVDMATGESLGNLEEFATWRDGRRFKAADFNFWGVTFARDSNVFYATLMTAGKTYLVRGDLGLRKLTVLRENVECPSLSPDNTLIAFKKKVGTGLAPWRFYVMDLATLADRPIAGETRSIDDQIEWLDATRVLYGGPRADQPASSDVWVAPIDNSAAARIFLPDAESPIVVR